MIVSPRFLRLSQIGYRNAVDSRRHLSTRSPGDGVLALILGKPGGGKGTISGKILNDFNEFRHLSTGDVLRRHVREETQIGKEAQDHINSGSLVPDDLIIRLVMEDAKDVINEGNSLLLDGFPRTLKQAQALEQSIHVDLVINLDIPTETIVQRISDRWIHPASGRVYNYTYKPPKIFGKDDITGEDLMQREDDKPEKVRNRLDAYSEATEPLIEFYSEKGVLTTFKGTMSDVIYKDIEPWLSTKLHENDDIDHSVMPGM